MTQWMKLVPESMELVDRRFSHHDAQKQNRP